MIFSDFECKMAERICSKMKQGNFTSLISPIKRENISKNKPSLFFDIDKDGVPNWKDCQPFNPLFHVDVQTQQQQIQSRIDEQNRIIEQNRNYVGDFAMQEKYKAALRQRQILDEALKNVKAGQQYQNVSQVLTYAERYAASQAKRQEIKTYKPTPITSTQKQPSQSYIDPKTGQGYSVSSQSDVESMIKSGQVSAGGTYVSKSGQSSIVQAPFVLQKPKVLSVAPQQQKTSSIIGLPPSEKQYFQESVEQSGGYISGVPTYIGGLAGRKYRETTEFFRRQFPKYGLEYEYYQEQPTQKLVTSSAYVAPYFVPYVGETLLIGGGTEKYATPKGREKIVEEAIQFEKKGIPREVSYILPAAQITLGGIGITSRISAAKKLKDIEKAETEFITVTEPVEGGAKAKTITKTGIGKEDYYTLSRQLFKEGEKESLGISKGYLVKGDTRVVYNPLKQKFEIKYPKIEEITSLGIIKSKGQAKLVREVEGLKASKDVGEETFFVDAFSKIAKEDVTRSKVLGVGRTQGEITSVVAGKPKLRIYRTGDVKYVVKEPKIRGYVVKEGVGEGIESIRLIGGNRLSKQVQKGSTKTAMESRQAVKSFVKSKVDKTPSTFIGSISSQIARTRLSQVLIPKEELSQQTRQSLISPTISKVDEGQVQKSFTSLVTGQLLDTTTTQKTSLKLLTAQSTTPIEKEVAKSTTTLFFPGESFPEIKERKSVLPPIILDLDKKQPVFKKEQPYDAYYLVEGTKKPRYEKIEGGLTLKSALGAMARVVDEQISARGKIVKTKPITKINKEGKKEKILQLAKDTKDPYWNQNKYKFRGYHSTLKGKPKQSLPTGVVIEKRKYRLDSQFEKRQIQREKRRTPFGF